MSERPKVIVVFDDNPTAGRQTEEQLKRAGFRALWASSAAQALYLLNPGFLGLVVIRLRLGGDAGLLLLTRVKQRWSRVPVIAVCESNLAGQQAETSGASGFICAPVEPTALIALVRAHLRPNR
jgi:DNA-binding response OmpR family regulator